MGACTVPGQLMIVTELMKGDLESLLVGKLLYVEFRLII